MLKTFRIHGDNIVECERIANLVIQETKPNNLVYSLISPSTIAIKIEFNYWGNSYSWKLELLPGFNKSGRKHWADNIFTALKENGSFLDETPDAIVTAVHDSNETILYAIEFCSALQAGNQAWQRSGRAFSTGRTKCPYLYIVDFVKYELDSRTRKRKALRFPNPAVPYSYINFSKIDRNFVAQVYVRSEEFDKSRNRLLSGFDEDDFAGKELSTYIVKKMCGLSTSSEEQTILQKNLNVVLFLSKSSNAKTNFTSTNWKQLFGSVQGIVEYAIQNSTFEFHKTITAKGHHGKSQQVLSLIDSHSVGLASRDLPFGIIPSSKRKAFSAGLKALYPSYDVATLSQIANDKANLIICLIKGFKPRGDDNRPDRGILPLAVMLSSTNLEVFTYLYGPVTSSNYNLLQTAPKRLASANGLWKSILALSNYVALDVPILSGHIADAELLIDSSALKKEYIDITPTPNGLTRKLFSSIPCEYHEDDVDTGIHYLFTHVLGNLCFEGMCNPPGGDWSGFSIIHKDYEKRWLSLPRVSDEVDGKRPDHILELFDVFDKPLLLSIESKEKSVDLEPSVGKKLVGYISNLMEFIPNVERIINPTVKDWDQATGFVSFNDYEVISVAAYLKGTAQSNTTVFRNSECDLLFIMQPNIKGWTIELVSNTSQANILKAYLVKALTKSGDTSIKLV